MALERTLVLIKPDAYARHLCGEILSRFERAGLSIEEVRVSRNETDKVDNHYPRDEEWLRAVGNKTLDDRQWLRTSATGDLASEDPIEIGRVVRSWLVDFLQSGPLVAVVLSGNRAIETARKIVGNTLPVLAAPGTLRGDYSCDSADFANDEKRPVANLVHASGDSVEAAREVELWFPHRGYSHD